MEPVKKPWASKTLLLNALVAIGMLLPWEPAREVLSEANMVMILSVVNMILRLVTKDRVGLH